MMKWCKDVCANKGRRKGVRMCVPTKAFCTDQTALHQETPGSRGVSWKAKKNLYIYNMCVYMGMHMYTCVHCWLELRFYHFKIWFESLGLLRIPTSNETLIRFLKHYHLHFNYYMQFLNPKVA